MPPAAGSRLVSESCATNSSRTRGRSTTIYPYESLMIERNLMATDPVVILSYARTPMGSFQGSLAGVGATQLGAAAVKAAVERAGVAQEDIERCYMGNVLSAGLGQA